MKPNIFSYKTFAWVVLIFLVFFSYYPSLYHMPRGDQVTYLINNLDNHTFKDILANSYSYTRSRQIDGGDYKLFRPVLHSLLAFHKYFFDTNFFIPQLIGILLHILILFLLWIILIRLVPGLYRDDKLIIFSLISFIALNPVLIEQVIWTHIQGYLLFVILMLSSFYFLLRIDDNPKKYIFLIWSILFVASFTYELGLLMTLLWGSYLFFSFKKANLKFAISILLCFLSIPVIYHIINWYDLNTHLEGPLQYYNLKEIFLTGSIMKMISNAIVLLGYTTLHPLIPSLARFSFGSRLVIGDLRGDGFNFFTLLSIMLISIIVFVSLFKFKSILKSTNKNIMRFIFLVFATYICYFSIIVFGRLNSNIHPSLLTSSSYYAYIGFILFFLLIIPFIIIGFSRLNKGIIIPTLIVIWALNFNDSKTVYKLNRDIKIAQEDLYSIVRDAKEFIVGNPPDVKVYFDLDNSEPIKSFHGVPFTSLLFRKYEDNVKPDFVAIIKNGNLSFFTREEYFKKNRISILGPKIIKVGPVFNTYAYNNKFYALHHLEGFFLPDNKEYMTLLKAYTLSEINDLALKNTHKKFEFLSLVGHEPIYLFDKNYKGFQLIRAFGLYYAIPTEAGPLDLFKIDKRISRKHYSSFFLEKSVSELKEAINAKDS